MEGASAQGLTIRLDNCSFDLLSRVLRLLPVWRYELIRGMPIVCSKWGLYWAAATDSSGENAADPPT